MSECVIFNDIVTIMNKTKLRDGLYQFNFKGVKLGSINKKDGTFTDSDGNIYYNINDSSSILDDDKSFYSFNVSLDKLPVIFDREVQSLSDGNDDIDYVNLYGNYTKNNLCFVRTYNNADGLLSCFVDVKKIDRIDSDLRIRCEDKTGQFLEGTFTESFDYELGQDRVESYLNEDRDYSVTDEELTRLIACIYNCEYNTSELLSMLDNFKGLLDCNDQVIETIKLQLLAYRNGDKVPNNPTNFDYDFRYSDYDPYSDDDSYYDLDNELELTDDEK